MSKYCVIVKLTKTTIEFRYQIDNDQVEFLTFNEKESEIPLAFYLNGEELIMGRYAQERASMNDSNAFVEYFELIKDRSLTFNYANDKRPIEQLLYLGVERYLTFFLKEKLLSSDWSIQSNRKDFPLRFAFANDLSNQEKRFVVDLFIKAGYRNVAEVLTDKTLFSVVSPSAKTKLLLSGLNGDLYISLYPSAVSPCKNSKMLSGIGTDPRYILCADQIFEEIQRNNPWMMATKSNNMEKLLNESEKVLKATTPIYLGNITFDTGDGGDFQINLTVLNDQLRHSQQSQAMISELEYFLKTEALQPQNVDVVLLGGVNTDYFAERLHEKFPSVVNVSLSDSVKVWNQVFATVDLTPPMIAEPAIPNSVTIPNLPPMPPAPSGRPSVPPTLPSSASSRPSMPPPPPSGGGRPSVPPTPPSSATKRPSVPPPPPSAGGRPSVPPTPPSSATKRPSMPPPPPSGVSGSPAQRTPQTSTPKQQTVSSKENRSGGLGFMGRMADAVGVNKGQVKEGISAISGALLGMGQKLVDSLDGGKVIIVGRNGTQKMTISDRSVSSEHCKLTRLDDGSYLVENLSPNGTYINGVKQEKGFAKVGDKIGLGANFVVNIKDLV